MQAVGGSGASVLARAMVRDMYEGARIGRELSRMAAIMALAPLVAPLIGGVLQTAFGWRSNFVALFCFGARGLDHGLVPAAGDAAPARAGAGVDRLDLRSYRRFLADAGFVIHLGIATCCLCGLFAWISSAAFVLQDIYGLSPLAFGVAFAIGSSGYLVGTTIAARFVMRWGSGRTMGFGAAAMALGGLVMVAAAGRHAASAPAGVIAAIGLYTDRHGHDAWPRRRPARCCPIRTAPAPRRRCSASSRRPRRRWSARSSATRSA